MTPEQMRQRTFDFAREVMDRTRPLLGDLASRDSALQLRRSAASVAANYRVANRAKSHRDFTSKLSTTLEEADESLHWLNLIVACGWLQPAAAGRLISEAEALVKILSRGVQTAKRRERG